MARKDQDAAEAALHDQTQLLPKPQLILVFMIMSLALSQNPESRSLRVTQSFIEIDSGHSGLGIIHDRWMFATPAGSGREIIEICCIRDGSS